MHTRPPNRLAVSALCEDEGPQIPKEPPNMIVRPEARACYRQLREDNRTLRRGDLELVIAYCLAWERLVEATRAIQTDGAWIENAKGDLRVHPAATVANQATTSLGNIATKLGLSKASRTQSEAKHMRPSAKQKTDFATAGGIRLAS